MDKADVKNLVNIAMAMWEVNKSTIIKMIELTEGKSLEVIDREELMRTAYVVGYTDALSPVDEE